MEGKKITSPIKAIRAMCLECSCGSPTEVRECHLIKCPLYAFRFGKNPYRKPISDAHREILRQRAKENFHSRKVEKKTED